MSDVDRSAPRPSPEFVDRLERTLLADLGWAAVDPTQTSRGRRWLPLTLVASIAAVVVGTALLVSSDTADRVTPTEVAVRPPEGSLPPDRYSIDDFAVPFTVDLEDGWSRSLYSQRLFVVDSATASIAVTSGVFSGATPDEVIDGFCRGHAVPGQSRPVELLGRPATAVDITITSRCLVILSTFVSVPGSRRELTAGASVRLVVTDIDGRIVAVLVDGPPDTDLGVAADPVLSSMEPIG